MKRILNFTVLIILFSSCQKQLIKPDQPQLNSVAANANKPIIFNNEGSVNDDEIGFNQCANEDMHLTGQIKYKLHYTIVDSSFVNYSATIDYNGITATGLITGNIYNAIGHDDIKFTGTAVYYPPNSLDNGGFDLIPVRMTISNKVNFTTSGHGNNFGWDLTYAFHTEGAKGEIEKINWTFSECK